MTRDVTIQDLKIVLLASTGFIKVRLRFVHMLFTNYYYYKRVHHGLAMSTFPLRSCSYVTSPDQLDIIYAPSSVSNTGPILQQRSHLIYVLSNVVSLFHVILYLIFVLSHLVSPSRLMLHLCPH